METCNWNDSMGKSKLPTPNNSNSRNEKKTKNDAKCSPSKEQGGGGGSGGEKKGVMKLFSWAYSASHKNADHTIAGSRARGRVMDRVANSTRIASSSSMPDAIASKSGALHEEIDEYYTLRSYTPLSMDKEHHHFNPLHQNDVDWKISRENSDDLYSELYPLSGNGARAYGFDRPALNSFTGALSRDFSAHDTLIHPPRPPPSWPLPVPKMDQFNQNATVDTAERWTTEHVDHQSSDFDRRLTPTNNAHIYDEIYTEIGNGRSALSNTRSTITSADTMARVITTSPKRHIDQMTPSNASHMQTFKRVPLITYERAKYVHLTPRLSEGSINSRYDYETRYIDIENDGGDDDDDVFVSEDHAGDTLKQQAMWMSLGNLASSEHKVRPSCGVWMAKLRATRRIYAELENLCAADSGRSTPRCSASTVPNCTSPEIGRQAAHKLDSGDSTPKLLFSPLSERNDGNNMMKQSPSSIMKYVQTDISPPKKVAGTQTSRTLIRSSRPALHQQPRDNVAYEDSSEEYERTMCVVDRLTKIPRLSPTGISGPIPTCRRPFLTHNKHKPPNSLAKFTKGHCLPDSSRTVMNRLKQLQQSKATVRSSSEGGSVSEDAYAGGSESSPESCETDTSYYTEFRSRSATSESIRPMSKLKKFTMNRSQSSIPFLSGENLSNNTSSTYESRKASRGSLSSDPYDQLIFPVENEEKFVTAVESELYSMIISSNLKDEQTLSSNNAATHANIISDAVMSHSVTSQTTTSSSEFSDERKGECSRKSYYEHACDVQLERSSIQYGNGAGTSDFSSDMDYAIAELLTGKVEEVDLFPTKVDRYLTVPTVHLLNPVDDTIDAVKLSLPNSLTESIVSTDAEDIAMFHSTVTPNFIAHSSSTEDATKTAINSSHDAPAKLLNDSIKNFALSNDTSNNVRRHNSCSDDMLIEKCHNPATSECDKTLANESVHTSTLPSSSKMKTARDILQKIHNDNSPGSRRQLPIAKPASQTSTLPARIPTSSLLSDRLAKLRQKPTSSAEGESSSTSMSSTDDISKRRSMTSLTFPSADTSRSPSIKSYSQQTARTSVVGAKTLTKTPLHGRKSISESQSAPCSPAKKAIPGQPSSSSVRRISATAVTLVTLSSDIHAKRQPSRIPSTSKTDRQKDMKNTFQ